MLRLVGGVKWWAAPHRVQDGQRRVSSGIATSRATRQREQEQFLGAMAARQGAPARNLTLTEELEKLEQSITLTLQGEGRPFAVVGARRILTITDMTSSSPEIDHNFSKAHRIVTTSILPVVEAYGEHSRAVWEASKFWKHFFEASANVSLSGYEELANDEDEGDETATTGADDTTAHGDGDGDGHDDGGDVTAASQYTPRRDGEGDSSLLLGDGDTAGDLTGSTPRPPATRTIRPQAFADLESPYEKAKREIRAGAGASRPRSGSGPSSGADDQDDDDSTALLQQHTARLPDLSMTPKGGASAADPSAGRLSRDLGPDDLPAKDRLLHRVLDKNYRLQATPHKGAAGQRVSPPKHGGGNDDTLRLGGGGRRRPAWADSPGSSPIMAAPTLRSAAFMSPVRGGGGPRLVVDAPRTPGVSVNTPAARKTTDLFRGAAGAGKDKAPAGQQKPKYEIDWESDSDGDDAGLYGGMSPPKTIQFALPPSKLLQTPGESSRPSHLPPLIVHFSRLQCNLWPAAVHYSATVRPPPLLQCTCP